MKNCLPRNYILMVYILIGIFNFIKNCLCPREISQQGLFLLFFYFMHVFIFTKSDFVPREFNNRTFFIRLRNWILNINFVTEYFFKEISRKKVWNVFAFNETILRASSYLMNAECSFK